MTCKDCLYCEKCYSRIRHFMDVDEGTGKLITDIEKRCTSFKNKAAFVEVVRCKDCVYFGESNNGGFMCGRADGLFMFPAENDFCSYGERRDNE